MTYKGWYAIKPNKPNLERPTSITRGINTREGERKTQQNSKCQLSGDRDKTIDYIIKRMHHVSAKRV